MMSRYLRIKSHRNAKHFASTVFFLALLISYPLLHADTRGKLSGTLRDQRNDPLIGANVLLVGTTLGASTDVEGNYVIINIPPGTYDVRISSVGYQTKIIQQVRIASGQTTTLSETLQEQVLEGEEIVVLAERPIVDVKQTNTVAILGKEDIAVLPVQELNDIVNLQAGVVSSGDGLHFRGGRVGEVQYQVNGVSVNNAYDNKSSVSIDRSLIQEVQVISGTFDAEYGQAMSGVVNTVLRTGGEQIQWNAEVFAGDFFYDGTKRGTTYRPRPGSLQNLQASLSGPTGVPETYFILSGRKNEFNDYIYGERRFVPTDKSDFEGKVFKGTGDGAEVPIGYTSEWSGLGRITNKSIEGLELAYQAIVNRKEGRRTNWAFRFNSDGLSKQRTRSLVHGLDLTHTLSSSTYYSVSFRQNLVDYKDYLYESLYDTRYDSAGSAKGDFNYEFGAIVQGVDFSRFTQETDTKLIQGTLTSQIDNEHMIKVGGEVQLHDVKFGNLGHLAFLEEGGRQTLVRYENRPPNYPPIREYTPISFAAYIQDRAEWTDITVRAGVRFEYFDAKSTIPSDLSNPANAIENVPQSVPLATTKKSSVAPRLAVSFPVSARASVYFSYGHFYQFPALGISFSNANYSVLSELEPNKPFDLGIFGNPDIKPEKTVHYEFGYRHAAMEYLGLSINMFYKDIRDLLGVEFIETYADAEYVRYTNIDFGNAFGFTFSLDQRRVGIISSSLDYTLSIASGNSSDPRETATRAAAGQDRRPRQIPLNWDQRHALNLTVQLSEHEDYSISGVLKVSSGQPYTPSLSAYGVTIEQNSGRKPVSAIVDLRAEKFFDISGTGFSVFARIFNALDARFNNGFVFEDTGSPDYAAIPGVVLAQLANPTRYNAPRRIEVGITLSSTR
ncbi:MAG: TonB-dependent receptor [Ignavibacteriales bacterium]|nr:TonB-dependent receptor [Ignavibacteriales bacterium]